MARKKITEELTKEMIIEEANLQFLESDFHKVSMRGIAQKLGCSHGAIYYHFNSKTELFHAVVERYFTMLNAKLEEAMEYKGAEGNMFVLMGFIEFGLNYQTQYQFMFMKRDDKLDPLSQSAANQSLEKFHIALQHLNNQQLEAKDIYSTFVGLHGFVIHYIGRTHSFEEAKESAKAYCEFLMKALI